MATAKMDSTLDTSYDSRTLALLGSEAMQRLAHTRVIIFGVGGVGSWCAESLIRSGIGHLTIVDSDCVEPTNINRQLMATTRTIGRPKVEALRERLLEIRPDADILALHETYTAETADRFALETYDYVVDAIDSVQHKAELILHATSLKRTLYSSMGAALRLDPTRIHVAEFWHVTGCPLAAALRNRFKRSHQMPKRKFRCVYSDEQPVVDRHAKGSLVHITAVFGFTLAGLLLADAAKSR